MEDTIFSSSSDEDFKFENQTFDNMLIERKLDTERDILFINCTFKELVAFENFTARAFDFMDCHFDKGLSIDKSTLNSLSFFNCDGWDIEISANSSHSLSLRSVKANIIEINGDYTELQIVSSTIKEIKLNNVNSTYSHRESKINFLEDNKIQKVNLECSTNFSIISFKAGIYDSVFFDGDFKKRILFSGNFEIKNLYLDGSVFQNRIDFECGIFEHVSFYRSLFKGLILISDVNYFENKPRELIIKSLTFHSCNFEKDVTVHIRKIQRFDTSNCNYLEILNVNNFAVEKSDLVMISLAGVNKGTIIIEKTYADISLLGINLGNIFFKDLDVSTFYLSEFQNTGSVSFLNVKSGLFFVIQDSISGNLNFLNSDINVFNEIIITNSNIDGANFNRYPLKILSFSKFPNAGYGIEKKSLRNHNLKNVYNQLKKTARLKGDVDSANRFESLEHRQLLLSKKISFDSILLFLNLLSNNNGRSWFQGIIFTLLVGLLFFTFYLKTIGINFGMDDCYQDYILFMTSFPKLSLASYYNDSWETQFIIWLSRIFISYGIYQTIAAFRKYGKG
ncbi:hypothetical protein [Flavobacterium geliluteum]|uniref:Uncharacterized protein n=1 Tax=Flavobacterium geliluteum TaxID=2816120 RepID=A0A940X8Q9_9FLAO|nr:hypothetical protein [Flavobacterium geliluteum]MBP4137256.1 hypothetical protein [Flavobacterium geliluteum]